MQHKKEIKSNTTKSKVISIRFSQDELLLLESRMQREKWENISGFIKYKILNIL